MLNAPSDCCIKRSLCCESSCERSSGCTAGRRDASLCPLRIICGIRSRPKHLIIASPLRPEQPCRLKIGVQKKGEQWEFLVKDNGIGIDPSQRHRIFVIFQRLHTQDKYPGTGIGLAVCKRIVERHGGCIWVDSETGKGSSFCFSLNPGVPHEFQQA